MPGTWTTVLVQRHTSVHHPRVQDLFSPCNTIETYLFLPFKGTKTHLFLPSKSIRHTSVHHPSVYKHTSVHHSRVQKRTSVDHPKVQKSTSVHYPRVLGRMRESRDWNGACLLDVRLTILQQKLCISALGSTLHLQAFNIQIIE